MDEGGSSGSVRTTRKNGRIETTQAMLKYDRLSAKKLASQQLVCRKPEKAEGLVGWLVGCPTGVTCVRGLIRLQGITAAGGMT